MPSDAKYIAYFNLFMVKKAILIEFRVASDRLNIGLWQNL